MLTEKDLIVLISVLNGLLWSTIKDKSQNILKSDKAEYGIFELN